MDHSNGKRKIKSCKRMRQFKHIRYDNGMRLTLCRNACEIRRPIRSDDENVVADSEVLTITTAYVNTY